MKHRKANTYLAVRTLIFASCLALALGAGAFGSGHTQTRWGRQVKVKTFTRMPLEVMEIRNLQKEGNWLRELKVEVKNISRHPIYFISLTLDFPDVPMPTPTPAPTPPPTGGCTANWWVASWCEDYRFDLCTCPSGVNKSPVLVDVLGNGFRLTDAGRGVNFDLDGDGTPERLSWTLPDSDDAWLALDRDGDGSVDDGSELCGGARRV